MSELLYNKSKAVEELNKVEGFYPLELARVISNEGQEEQRYLDVKYRKLWFRLVNPTGKIISRIVHFTENMAVVEARIYLDKCDQEDNYIANSFSQKFRTADTQFGDKFLEMAETAAIGRPAICTFFISCQMIVFLLCKIIQNQFCRTTDSCIVTKCCKGKFYIFIRKERILLKWLFYIFKKNLSGF